MKYELEHYAEKCYFAYTNECLEAIVAGLSLNENDDVLAVCGSGDQPFAMLEYTDRILAVDTYLSQVNYARKRKELILDGYFDEAFNFSDARTKNYFHRERIDKIRRNLEKLKIEHVNIEDVNYADFSKIYFSNVSGHNRTKDHRLGMKLLGTKEGTLLYFSNDFYFSKALERKFEVDNDLSHKAQRLQEQGKINFTWYPVVYRTLPKHAKLV